VNIQTRGMFWEELWYHQLSVVEHDESVGRLSHDMEPSIVQAERVGSRSIEPFITQENLLLLSLRMILLS
jgi:hypothetical protein